MLINVGIIIIWFVMSLLLFWITLTYASKVSVTFRNIYLLAYASIYIYLIYQYVTNNCHSVTMLFDSNCNEIPIQAFLAIVIVPIVILGVANMILKDRKSKDIIEAISDHPNSNDCDSQSLDSCPQFMITIKNLGNDLPPAYDSVIQFDEIPTYESVIQSEEMYGHFQEYPKPCKTSESVLHM